MLAKLSIALATALLTALVALALQERWTGIPPLELLGVRDGPPTLGFRAEFVDVDAKPSCTLDGWSSPAWRDGPHEGFDTLDPADLARRSLDWYEATRRDPAYKEHDVSWLLLNYRSGDEAVELRYDAGSGRSWEQQLRDWFARFPPSPGG